MKEFIEFIVRPLEDNPEQVVLEDEVRDDKIILTLLVADQDCQKGCHLLVEQGLNWAETQNVQDVNLPPALRVTMDPCAR